MINIVCLILKVDMKGSGVESAIQPPPVSNIDTNNYYYFCPINKPYQNLPVSVMHAVIFEFEASQFQLFQK